MLIRKHELTSRVAHLKRMLSAGSLLLMPLLGVRLLFVSFFRPLMCPGFVRAVLAAASAVLIAARANRVQACVQDAQNSLKVGA
jgi:hypothetical protein